MKKIVLLLIVAVALLPQISFSQSRQITGTVTNESGEPLSSASIVEKGTNNGTTTDETGAFKISINTRSPILLVSYAGMSTQRKFE